MDGYKKHFPDAKFRAYVKKNFDTDGDGKLSADECLAVRDIQVNDAGIKSLKGIEHFTELHELYCNNNRLKQLNVSKNVALVRLSCDNNSLTKLDVSKNTALAGLFCGINRLTKLDVSKNTALEELFCSNTGLTKLNVSKNARLHTLFAYDSAIKTIDLKNCNELKAAIAQHKKKATKKYVKRVFKGNEFGDEYGVYIDASTTLTNGGEILYQGK